MIFKHFIKLGYFTHRASEKRVLRTARFSGPLYFRGYDDADKLALIVAAGHYDGAYYSFPSSFTRWRASIERVARVSRFISGHCGLPLFTHDVNEQFVVPYQNLISLLRLASGEEKGRDFYERRCRETPDIRGCSCVRLG